MPDANQSEALSGPIRAIQIICAAISVGPIIFLFIVLFAIPPGTAGALAGPPVITYAAIVFALVTTTVRSIILNVIVSRDRTSIARGQFITADGRMANDFISKTGDAGRLLLVYQKRMIAGAALLEGCAFFLIIAYMLERSPYALAAGLLLLLGLLAQIPSRAAIERWIEEQYQLVEKERAESPSPN